MDLGIHTYMPGYVCLFLVEIMMLFSIVVYGRKAKEPAL
jgi:hypothetical protein